PPSLFRRPYLPAPPTGRDPRGIGGFVALRPRPMLCRGRRRGGGTFPAASARPPVPPPARGDPLSAPRSLARQSAHGMRTSGCGAIGICHLFFSSNRPHTSSVPCSPSSL